MPDSSCSIEGCGDVRIRFGMQYPLPDSNERTEWKNPASWAN